MWFEAFFSFCLPRSIVSQTPPIIGQVIAGGHSFSQILRNRKRSDGFTYERSGLRRGRVTESRLVENLAVGKRERNKQAAFFAAAQRPGDERNFVARFETA